VLSLRDSQFNARDELTKGWLAGTAWILFSSLQPSESRPSMASGTHVLFCRLADFNSNTMPGGSSEEIPQIQQIGSILCLASLPQAQQAFACPLGGVAK
jgi:hypothetical protein